MRWRLCTSRRSIRSWSTCCGIARWLELKTVVDSLLPLVDDEGRIHTTFNQTIASTGRLSSTDPNLQNIPVRTAEGRRIREAFTVGPGYESLMTADYSQIEMRIMAHLSGDAGLIEAFTTGEDLHSFVASRAFDLPPEAIDAELRRRVKAMSYGLAYGLSAFGLAQQLKITPDEARGQMDAYFARFGGVRDYLRSVVDDARRTGYTETIMGRRRYLPDLTSDNRQRREMAERMALNAPIQGSAADIIKVAMLGVHAGIAPSRACGLACCCRSTTSWCWRSRQVSAVPSRRSSGRRWVRPIRSRCRSTCRSGSASTGTTLRTEPLAASESAARARIVPHERESQRRSDIRPGQHHDQAVDADPQAAGRRHRVLQRGEERLVDLHRLGIARGGEQRLLGQPARWSTGSISSEYAVPISAPKATRSQRSASRGSSRCSRVSGEAPSGSRRRTSARTCAPSTSCS